MMIIGEAQQSMMARQGGMGQNFWTWKTEEAYRIQTYI
jgi:hypothetical protein